MNTTTKVAVCSRSFSNNPILKKELLEKYKNVTFNDRGLQLKGDSLIEFLTGHEKAITALEVIDEYVLSRLPDLKVIGKYGVGLDMIDMAAMRTYGKKLGWIGGVNRRSVSELVIAFAISMLRNIPSANREVLSGTWRQHIGGYLTNRTVGIIGCGHIGKDLVKLLKPFECKVIVYDILDFADFYKENGIRAVSLEDLLQEADIVTLHIPLNQSTKNILDSNRLALLKSTAILINTARGELVDEIALKKALQENKLAAAAFDVFAIEPPSDQELLSLPNFLATPHIGGSAAEAILAMGRAAIEGLDQNEIPN
ncbi:phosphoglycerate dehydrogenase [Leptospira kmetyi]|uniref:Phosphoglycerate dehydrogenase n=1 Tax=Leptospira kmetyi TaxID=408139 RepID=A0A5F1XZH7_9LEPT|nr:phosphoglycerate dehydrogenase [Leptospira kmetyi]AYV57223.1 phosphoglycerate dehydrogenase [Leptospira kmetyi]TGK21414.1 phosphoglycerate dehydrogenase [Leptospira kmetyi]TGK28341.1 phosphoglycerate dehydrogenase [Leptospira kmetyi]